MSIEDAKEILTKDVQSGCLDELVVKALLEIIDTGELSRIFE